MQNGLRNGSGAQVWVTLTLLVIAGIAMAGRAHSWPEQSAGQVVVHSTAELLSALNEAKAGRVRSIRLAAGRYRLTAPIIIDARMSGTPAMPFTLEALPGAYAELNGARVLPELNWERQGQGVWRARLLTKPFKRLWLGDEGLILARYPNYQADILPFGGVSADATSPDRVGRWASPAGGVLHALHGSRWGSMHVPILGKARDGTLIYGPATGNNRESAPSPNERFVENIREELDAPLEWFYDASDGWLYFKPKDDAPPPTTGFFAGTTESLIQVTGDRDVESVQKAGVLQDECWRIRKRKAKWNCSPSGKSVKGQVHDIRITGLAFRGTEPTYEKTTEPLLRSDWKFYRGGTVLIQDASRITLEDSNFQDLGGNAVVVSGRARDVVIRRNLFERLGASAIAFVGKPEAVRSALNDVGQALPFEDIDRTPGPRSGEYVSDSLAQDNLIHDIGLIEKQAAGVQISMAARISVDHNSIYRVPRAGINIGDGTWGGHQISNNDVFDTVRETGDHGAFNSWGRDRYWVPDRPEMESRTLTERSLVYLDAQLPVVLRHNRFRCDHGWDIDLDDGSSNYVIEDNVLLSGGLKLREGFDRKVRNNILVNNSLHPHLWFANGNDIFEHNIVMAAYQPVFIKVWGKSVDFNLFAREADLKIAHASGSDAHSVAGDPGFLAPETGDFRVREDSPALSIGFHNLSMDDFGVRPPRLARIAEKPVFLRPISGVLHDVFERTTPFAGMSIKSVETLGEQSSAGLPNISGVLIVAVAPGSLAAQAGLRQGDVILATAGTPHIAGQEIKNVSSFMATLKSLGSEKVVGLVIFRNQKRMEIRLSLPTPGSSVEPR